MIHPYTQAIFDKHDRGEAITAREWEYLTNCCKPPTLKQWVIIIGVQPFLLAGVLYIINLSTGH